MNISRRQFVKAASSTAVLGYTGVLQASDKSTAGIAVNQIRQQIDGFGFCEAFHQARNLQTLSDKDKAAILDLMFSPSAGMGYSILRNIIGDGAANQKVQNGSTESIEPNPGEFNWTGDEDQIWMMNEAKKRGCTRFLSSCWSPPAWMKTNKSVENGGELKTEMYQQFADYLATYVLEYKKRYDLDIYAISPTNEPNYTATWASCRWTASQLKKFLHQNLIPTFAQKGVTAEIVIDEHASWSDEFINEILSDSACDKAIRIVAAHAYAATTAPYMPLDTRTGQFSTAIEKGKRIWETEVSVGGNEPNITNMNDGVYWARVIHAHMTEDNVSAWLYWWGAAVASSRGSLITLDMKAKTYQLSKRMFTIGHFARFIRPGYHRVDATPNPAPNVFFSAYLDPSGKKLVCVAINDDAVERPFTIQYGSFPATSCTAVRTSNTETHARLPKMDLANGQLAVTTAPLSVTTYIFT
jgi:glucuronoarabinoxylan endo-1,4-beta-xylanase